MSRLPRRRNVDDLPDPIRHGDCWLFADGTRLPVVAGGAVDTANATDAMIRRLEDELEERNAFVQGLVAGAQDAGRDLNSSEMELIGTAQGRIGALGQQLIPLRETSKITIESRARAREIDAEISNQRRRNGVGPVEYRSAGAYAVDYYLAGVGDDGARERLEVFHRAAAHQTTADNPGLLPQQIVEPVLMDVDAARPLVSAIGPRELGAGSYAYARVTQHTLVAQQTAEKAELASRKMIVTITPITAPTYGGYVNVSKQNIRRTSPQILDMVINDLGGEYAIETEDVACTDLTTAATAGAVTIPADPTALQVSQAVWGAVGQAAAGLRTARIPAMRPILAVAPDRMALVGPLFPSINPMNAASSGFTADGLALPGPQGNLAGLTVVMTAGLAAGTILFLYGSAVRCFEDRYGALQVNEPSVWGVQVGYAGDFETAIYEAAGIVSIEEEVTP